MRLSTVEASNFRSYREKFEVVFSKPINVLIGRNNTGKSNLLEFLRWVQQLGFSGSGRPATEYFHSGTGSGIIRASIIFALEDEERNELISGYVNSVARENAPKTNLLREARLSFGYASEGIVSEKLEVSNAVDDWIPLVQRSKERDVSKVAYAPLGNALYNYKGSGNVVPDLTQNYVEGGRVNQILTFNQDVSTPIPIVGLVREFFTRVFFVPPVRRPPQSVGPGQEYVVDGAGQNLPRVFQTLQTDRPRQFNELVRAIQRTVPDLEITAPPRSNQVTLKFEEPGGVNVLLANTSEGIGNILTIVGSILTLPMESLILVEEPEIHLHASAQRELFKLITHQSKERKLQFLISTHSTIFAKTNSEVDTWLITKKDGGSSVRRLICHEDLDFLKHELGHENTDLFGYNTIVVVEGQSEERSLPIIASNLGIDFETLGIRVYGAGGSRVTRIEHLLEFLKDSGTRVYLVVDEHGTMRRRISDWNNKRLIDETHVKVWHLEFEDLFRPETIVEAFKLYQSDHDVIEITVPDIEKATSPAVSINRFLGRKVFEKTGRELAKPRFAECLGLAAGLKHIPNEVQDMLVKISHGESLAN